MGKARFTVVLVLGVLVSGCNAPAAKTDALDMGVLTETGCKSLYFDGAERKAEAGALVRNTKGKIVAVSLEHRDIDPASLIVSVFGIQQRAVQLTREGLLRLLEPADSDAEIDVAYCPMASTASL